MRLPTITHLLFADDSLLLLKVDDENATCLQQVLQLYEDCSGQVINKKKSSVLFSRNTQENMRDAFLISLGVSQEAHIDKYLGLPIYMGRSKKKMFSYLKDRVWKRIQGWKEKLLSRVGKEILIKAVAQAIPTYAMSCFDLTKSLCNDISAMIGRFWWAQQENEKKMHLLSWSTLTSRKEKGGLGYRDLHMFILAMLGRQAWRMLQNFESLCARLLKARYWPNGELLQVQEHPGISYTWRSFVRGIRALEKGLIWRVGNGQQIRIWEDPWLPGGITRRPRTPRGMVLLNKVSDLMDQITGGWDSQLIKDMFWEEDAALILFIPTRLVHEDFAARHFDPKGKFSIKSAYHVLVDDEERGEIRQVGESSSSPAKADDQLFWKKIWWLDVCPKAKQFILESGA